MTTGDGAAHLPHGLLGPEPLLSHVWTDRDGTAVCLVSPRAPAPDEGGREWLCAEGDAFVDAADYH